MRLCSLKLPFSSDLASVITQSDPNRLFCLQRAPKHLASQNCLAVLLHGSVRPLSFHAIAEFFGLLRTHRLASYISLRPRNSWTSFPSPKAIVTMLAKISIIVAAASLQDPLDTPFPVSMDCGLSPDASLSTIFSAGILCSSVFALALSRHVAYVSAYGEDVTQHDNAVPRKYHIRRCCTT